jgi:hypothetical protein
MHVVVRAEAGMGVDAGLGVDPGPVADNHVRVDDAQWSDLTSCPSCGPDQPERWGESGYPSRLLPIDECTAEVASATTCPSTWAVPSIFQTFILFLTCSCSFQLVSGHHLAAKLDPLQPGEHEKFVCSSPFGLLTRAAARRSGPGPRRSAPRASGDSRENAPGKRAR